MSIPEPSTPVAGPAPHPAPLVSAVRSVFSGVSAAPGDPDYDQARSGYGLTHRPSPDLVAFPTSTEEVQRLVAAARRVGAPVAVQGTGHNVAFAYRGGLMIHTGRLREVRFDDEADTVTVGAGARWRDVLPGAQRRGRAPLSGSSPDVGVLGYALHGGIGWLARAYGSAAASIRSASLVTADARLVRVDPRRHPDLFWALRGAGGNFGVVVALELALFPAAHVYGGARMYPLERAPDVLRHYRRWVSALPEAMTSSVALLRLPPLPQVPEPLRGRAWVALRACYAGDADEARAWLEPWDALGAPVVDSFRAMAYADSGEISADPSEPSASWRTSLELARIDDPFVDTLLRLAGPGVESPLTVVELRHLGGALARPTRHDAGHAFGLRSAPFALQSIAPRHGPAGVAAVERATAELAAALAPYGTGGVLPGWLGDGDGGPERVRAGYAADAWARLRRVKRRWDPDNVFRLNHNVAPEATADAPGPTAADPGAP